MSVIPLRRRVAIDVPNQGGFSLNQTPHYSGLEELRFLPSQQHRPAVCSEGVIRFAAAVLDSVVHDLRLGDERARAWVLDQWAHGTPAIRIGTVAAMLGADVDWLRAALVLRARLPRGRLPYLQPSNRLAHRRLGRHARREE